MLAKDAKNLIKERLNIVDVVRRYVELKPNGSRWTAPCPFHQETKPSFYVSEDKGLYHCFGCQAHGDVIDFYSKINGLDFRDAILELASDLGISVEFGKWSGNTRDKEELEKTRARKNTMLRLHEVAASFFKSSLQGVAGAECRAYISNRGIDPAILKTFEIGFAPADWHGLFNALKRAGLKPELACEAGLLRKSPSGRIYDAFRGRLMFPIKNPAGQVIAFGGRIINNSDEAKYINSPDTPIYKKGEHLYGFFQAGKAIREKGFAFLTEGYMDVLTLHQFGYNNGVGVLGTALTSNQIKRLSGCSRVVLLFDGDNAGRKAAFRASELFLCRGLNCGVALMPEGEDIDSLLRAKGKPFFEKILQNSSDAFDFCIDTVEKFAPRAVIDWAHNFLSNIQLPELSTRYATALSLRLNISEDILRASLDKIQTGKLRRQPEIPHTPSEQIAWDNKYEEQILIYAVRYPHRVADLRNDGADLLISSTFARQFWEQLRDNQEELPYNLNDKQQLFWNRHTGPLSPPLANEAVEYQSIKKLLEFYFTTNRKNIISSALAHGADPGNFESDLEYLRALQQTLEKEYE